MTLPISIEHARELARLVEHETHPELVLVGAVALGHHLPLQRTTADVDLALVMWPDDIVPLLTTLGWRRDEHMRQRWYGPAHFRADIIPATQELVAAGSVQIDEGATMSLVGFDLAFDHAVPVELPGTTASVSVASLPAILVLKMVAWLDRPYGRTKDLGDIAAVLTEALGDDDDRRWDSSHPVATNELDFDEQSPFFAGLEVAAIAKDAHLVAIRAFVEQLLDESEAAAAVMARAAGIRGDDAEQRMQRLVAAFDRGLRAERGTR